MFKKNIFKIPTSLLYILFALILIRVTLPMIGKYAVNWYLKDKILPYTGRIEDFDLSILRGAYQFEGFVIEKYREDQKKKLDPLIKADLIDVSLAWRALFKGRLLGDLNINKAEITFLDGTKNNTQSGMEEDLSWKDVFVTLIPIDIEDLKIHNSIIAFKNYDLKEPINVYISQIELRASNINNSERKSKTIFSDLNFSAKLQDQAPIHIKGSFDILSKIPAYDLSLTIKEFNLPIINKLLFAYGPVTFTRGNLSVYSEMATQKTRVDGYVKAFFKNLDVVAPKEVFDSFKHFLYEMVTALGNLLLRSSEKKEIAFRVPIEGPITQLSVSGKEAFFSALKNTFKDEKLKEGLEKSISMEDVKKGKKPEASAEEKKKIKAL
ncbi:MAG: DUF748 domain-containing protein [Bdellovibrionota bacterium]